MLRCGSLIAHDFHTVCNFDVSDPLHLLIAVSGLGKNVGLAVPTPIPTEPASFFPPFLSRFPFFLHVKILPLFGLRKNSFLTLLFYRFLPLIGRFFFFSFLFVTADGKAVCMNSRNHNPDSPLLIGQIGSDDEIKERKMFSYKTNQIQFDLL